VSDYRHDPKKFADTGLQLRLPVDAIPPNQYARLTNALPVIEGELRTRDGLTEFAKIYPIAFLGQVGRPDLLSTDITQLRPITNTGFVVGQSITITIYLCGDSFGNSVPLGIYTTTIVSIAGTTLITIPAGVIPGVWGGAFTAQNVYAQIVGNAIPSTLPTAVITNIYRLNQSIPADPGDRLVAMGMRLYRAHLPIGTAFQEVVRWLATPGVPGSFGAISPAPIALSGRPLTIISFRFTLDPASWAIIGDYNGMWKYRSLTTGLVPDYTLQPLGNATPLLQAAFTAGGVGVLNSTGGTPYDWRYTWFNSLVQTEGNPSPIASTTPSANQYPASFTQGAVPVANPGNCINGTDAAITEADATVAYIPFPTPSWQTFAPSCQYFAFPVPVGATSLVLTCDAKLVANTGGGAGCSGSIQYSTDGGATWITAITPSGARQYYTFTLPLGLDMSTVRVRIYTTATAGGSGSSIIFQVWDLKIVGGTSTTPLTLALVNQTALVCVQDPAVLTDNRITGIRLYRRGGSLPDAWRQVGTFDLTSLTAGGCGALKLQITDNVSDTQLSTQPILDLDNDAPVTSISTSNVPLSFIWGPVGLEARVMGCGDPNRPESVYFSKPGNADAWPPENFIEVSDPGTPMIGGCGFNTRVYAASREAWYELVEGLGTGTTFSPFKTPSAHGLFCPQGLALGPAIYFVAKDGIYVTTGGQEHSLVEDDIKPLFPTYDSPGRQVETYEAVDMTLPDNIRLRYHNDELYFSYTGTATGTRQLLIYDILKKRWRGAEMSVSPSEIYSEPNTTSSLLYGMVSGEVYQAGGSSDPEELDVIENASIFSSPLGAVTLAPGSYFARLSRITAAGEVALSPEFPGIVVDAVHGIAAVVPVGQEGTTAWRVYYGLVSGLEDHYVQFAGANPGTVGIVAPGTAGTPQTVQSSSDILVNVRTGAHDQGAPLNRKQYGNVIFDIDPGGATNAHPVVITPYINGEVASEAAIQVTGFGRQQVPLDLSDYFAFNTEYQITWSRSFVAAAPNYTIDPVLFQYDTLHFLEPVGVLHWQSQPTSFAFPGFMHCRDAYIAIRSTASVTLTMVMDAGTGPLTQTYVIPSTGGKRLKVYIQFAPNKALLYQFSLDSAVEFRVYETDLEIRCKPWLGVLGYQVMRTLGGETGA
jgi:hypothetical protein